MAGFGRGLGRGDAIKRFLEEQKQLKPPEPPQPAASEPPAPPPRSLGRGFLSSFLLAAQKQEAANVSSKIHTQSTISPPRQGHTASSASKTGQTRERSRPVEAVEYVAEDLGELSLHDQGYANPPIIMKGSSGNPLSVTCNYIRLLTEEGKGIFQYRVQFEPDVDSRGARFNIMKQLVNITGTTKSFDGATLYLPVKLEKNITVAKAELPTDQSEVVVKMIFVKCIEMGHPYAIQMYNILFRRIMNILGLSLHGRHFFDPHGAKPIPEQKLEVWPGFVTAIQNFEDGVMLCCNASHRVLRTQTVHELMMDLIQLARGPDTWKQQFSDLMIGQVVLTRYNNKVYKVDDIDFNANPNNTFSMKSGDQISYVDYYSRHYDVQITDKGQPLLKSKVKAKIRGEEVSQMVDLIPELCFLSGITDTMRADHRVMKSIAQCTRISPGQRQVALRKFLDNINGNKDVVALLKGWGLRLSPSNLMIPARVVQAEDIYFGGGEIFRGSLQCDWTRGATSNHVLSAIDLKSWAIICTIRDVKIAEDFAKTCHQVGPRIGIQVSKPTFLTLKNDNTENYLQQLVSLRQQHVQMVVVIFPIARSDKYSAVKKMCCIQYPVPSQVIITRTIRDPAKLRSVTQKIVLQMNCKLGGTLWTVKIPIKNTMVLGMDSFHDANHQSNSYGAIVASLNAPLTRWYSRIYQQGVGIEIMDGLDVSITYCLNKYKEVNDVYPEQIFVFRDGVGDGQLNACTNHEVPQILTACSRLDPNYVPKLLFVVVQKNINTRFFAESRSEFSNPPPGSVLDHSVTRRDMFDFFLVSQSVRQGTVSPSHYIVAHNTTNLDPDKIQRFTFKLTHLYYNWCGTVRVPAPCQYAHKLASLVGDSLHKQADDSLADKLYYL